MTDWTTAALAALMLGSCVSCNGIPYFNSKDTPENTLRTFQSAYAEDDPLREFGCFSREIQPPYQNYTAFREKLLRDHALVELVLTMNDLTDNVTHMETLPDNTVVMTISVFGQEARFRFINEPRGAVTFADGTTVDDPLMERPLIELMERWLVVPLGPLIEREQVQQAFPSIRTWRYYDDWRFLELAQ